MEPLSLQFICILLFPCLCTCLLQMYNPNYYRIIGPDPGPPLILTPLIEAGKIKEAQSASSMRPMKSNITSFSGFFKVNKNTDSNMYFIFFPALQCNEKAPLILWLQGGPGASSLIGLFHENGPFSIRNVHDLELRQYAWTNCHNLLYIDNPVGTGFSFTKNDNGYSTTEEQVAGNLYAALIQFFILFPQFQKNDFFVTGESYAGKYVPAISYTIHKNNPTARLKINLKGLAIGNGLIDPEHMLNYGDYLYQIGLLDSNGRDMFHDRERKILSYIQQKNWRAAFNGYDALLNGDFTNTTLFNTLTNFTYYFNYLHNKDVCPNDDIVRYVSYPDIRKNLHVGNLTFEVQSKEVEIHLIEDIMQSVKPWVETLIENYRILIYSGQLDIIVAFPLTECFLDSLKWSGSAIYKKAPRKFWYVGEELAGYIKMAKSLTVVLVRNAGHMVPTDQPKWSLDLISRFTHNIPFA